jgi:hypothetical protein
MCESVTLQSSVHAGGSLVYEFKSLNMWIVLVLTVQNESVRCTYIKNLEGNSQIVKIYN